MGSKAIEKFRKFKAMAKAAGSSTKKHAKEKLPSVAYALTRYGGHTAAGVATKAVPSGFFGVGFLKPDVISIVAGGLAMGAAKLFKRKAVGKFTSAWTQGSVHAWLGRVIYESHFTPVAGPDGKVSGFKFK